MFGGLGRVMDISILFARDAEKNSQIQEMATDGDKFASFLRCLQREAKAEGIQGGLRGECQ
jgi:hypothetical protein